MSQNNPWQTLDVRRVYDNPWIEVTHREVINPSGRPGIYGVVHFKNIAIGIVPLDDDLNTWLVGQYRYTIDRYSWEIPEGGCPIGIDPLDGAKRELLEETGIEASEWIRVLDMYLSNSVSDEQAITYVARKLRFGQAQPEETEDLQLRKVPLSEAIDMVLRGEITDSLAVASLLSVKMMLDKGAL